jgi:secondary thiamine-phosphate synthase enzyme
VNVLAAQFTQSRIVLSPKPRGIHLVTREIVAGLPDLSRFRVGLAHLFIEHTSASLALNENASPDVRTDLDGFLDRLVPDGTPHFRHTTEGADDMPAHVKAALLGSSLVLPIRDGRLGLGTWQGVYLCEHRDHGGSRRVTATLFGESKQESI